jgi:hypothetical protein
MWKLVKENINGLIVDSLRSLCISRMFDFSVMYEMKSFDIFRIASPFLHDQDGQLVSALMKNKY